MVIEITVSPCRSSSGYVLETSFTLHDRKETKLEVGNKGCRENRGKKKKRGRIREVVQKPKPLDTFEIYLSIVLSLSTHI